MSPHVCLLWAGNWSQSGQPGLNEEGAKTLSFVEADHSHSGTLWTEWVCVASAQTARVGTVSVPYDSISSGSDIWTQIKSFCSLKKRSIESIKEMKELNQKHLCMRPLKSKLEVILNRGICSHGFKRWKHCNDIYGVCILFVLKDLK